MTLLVGWLALNVGFVLGAIWNHARTEQENELRTARMWEAIKTELLREQTAGKTTEAALDRTPEWLRSFEWMRRN